MNPADGLAKAAPRRQLPGGSNSRPTQVLGARLRWGSEILERRRPRTKWLQFFLAEGACTTLDDSPAALRENSTEQRVGCSDSDVSQRTQEAQADRDIASGIQAYLLESRIQEPLKADPWNVNPKDPRRIIESRLRRFTRRKPDQNAA